MSLFGNNKNKSKSKIDILDDDCPDSQKFGDLQDKCHKCGSKMVMDDGEMKCPNCDNGLFSF